LGIFPELHLIAMGSLRWKAMACRGNISS